MEPTNPPKYPEFGARLSSLLEASDKKVKELAATLKVSPQMVGRYLRGDALPGAERILTISEFLGVSPSELLGGEKPIASGPKRHPAPNASLGLLGPEPRLPGGLLGYMTTATSPRGFTHTQESLFEPEALSMLVSPGVPDLPRVPLTPAVWKGVSLGVSRIEVLILHALREYCDRAPLARAVDATAVADLRVRGPYGRAVVDIAVTVEGRPAVGIEIKSGIGGQLSALTGVALNWKLATDGAPLLVVWVVPTTPEDRSRMEPIREDLRALREPAPGAAMGPLIDSTWVLPSDDPEAGLVGLLTRVSEILTGPR